MGRPGGRTPPPRADLLGRTRPDRAHHARQRPTPRLVRPRRARHRGDRMSDEGFPAGVYVVILSNYEPAEVAGIYNNRPAAEAHADALGDSWRVAYWPIASDYDPHG